MHNPIDLSTKYRQVLVGNNYAKRQVLVGDKGDGSQVLVGVNLNIVKF